MRQVLLVFISIFISTLGFTQSKWQDLRDQGANFYEIEEAFNEEWEGREYERGRGYTLFQRWKNFIEPRISPSGDIQISHHYTKAVSKAKKSTNSSFAKAAGDWFALGYTEWETDSYNPGNGRVNLIEKDPNVSGRYFVGTPAGGLWVTNDNFNSWQPLTDDLPTLGISGICITPENSDVIYIATGDSDGRDTYSNGVLKSTDGGLSWQTTGLSHLITTEVRINKLLMHPNDSDILFAATKSGLWKTTTGGEVWYEVRGGTINDIEFNPGDPSIMYCCSNRIYRSTDGGEDFDIFNEGMPAASAIEGIELAVSPDEPDYLYALCIDNSTNGFLGLYRSTDAAESFEERSSFNSPNILGWASDGSSVGGQGLYNLALDVDPNDAETLFLGGVNVWKSVNGGNSYIVNSHWVYDTEMTLNYVHADIHYIRYLGDDLFVCSDGGVFRSTNEGDDFTDVSKGLQISQFYRIGGYDLNENLLLGGTQDNGSIRYSGNSWIHELGADGMEAAIHPANPNVMYVCSQNGNIRRSLDGGVQWANATNTIEDNGGWVTPYVLDPSAQGTIYAGYRDVWKSTNNGASYTQVSDFNSNLTMRDMAISETNSDVVYTCTSNTLFKSSDAGQNWLNVASNIAPTNMTYVDINPADENDVVITFSGFVDGQKVFRTLDGGENWTNISGNLPNIPVNCVAIDSDNGELYVGTDLGIYYLDSELQGWIPFSEGLPNVIVNEIEINNLTGQLTAATFGRGIWRSDQFNGSEELPVALFEAENRIICVGESVEFSDLSFGHAPEWDWTFEGADETSSTAASPVITYSEPGFYEVSLTVSNANGESTHSESSYIYVQAATETYPYSEGFEEGSELEPYEFTSIATQGNVLWKVNSSVGYEGGQSIWVDNGFQDEPYETELFSKQFDFSNIEDSIWLTFEYAYAQKHEDNDERLRFFVSSNCGETYQLRDQLRGTQDLNTAQNLFLGDFVPQVWNWQTFSYNISGSELSEAFSFKLALIGDNGNHVYIDNINLSGINLSVDELEAKYDLWLFPNPAADLINVQFNIGEAGSIELVNTSGQTVKVIDNLRAGLNSLRMETADLSAGIYYLKFVNNAGVGLVTEKVIIH